VHSVLSSVLLTEDDMLFLVMLSNNTMNCR
jgi:hypothetical protein